MPSIAKIVGERELRTRLKAETARRIRGLRRGLRKGGLFLQRESQKIVPVDTGALKNSAFTRDVTKVDTFPVVIVGYTINYAIFVHENVDAKHKPGKVAKFLEKPARERRAEILQIVLKETV